MTKPANHNSAHWDFVRGLSMAVMAIMHTTSMVGWRPFRFELMAFCYPLIEPIIFLSGFLICWRTTRHIARENFPITQTMKLYAARRVIRTWPLYFLLVAVCFIF